MNHCSQEACEGNGLFYKKGQEIHLGNLVGKKCVFLQRTTLKL